MHFEEGLIYHIYNRGNNKDQLFYQPRNYLFFLQKIRTHLFPICDILGYCLMPNHFHLMIRATQETIAPPLKSKICKSKFGEAFKILLTSYTRAINKQENRTGSLFAQHTIAKPVQSWTDNFFYADYCFYYIHKNPLSAKLVKRLKNWPYSSFLDYAQLREGTLCDMALTKELLTEIDWENFVNFMHDYQFESGREEQIF